MPFHFKIEYSIDIRYTLIKKCSTAIKEKAVGCMVHTNIQNNFGMKMSCTVLTVYDLLSMLIHRIATRRKLCRRMEKQMHR